MMYDITIWDYPDDAVFCFKDVLAFCMRHEEAQAILTSTLRDYRDDCLTDYRGPLADIDALSSSYGISGYTLQFILYITLLDEAELKYRKEGLSALFYDSFDDLRVKNGECWTVHSVYGTFVAPWLAGFFQRTRFGFGRLEAEKRTDEIRIHIPAKGKLLEEECQKSYERASAFFHLSRIATESWLLAPWMRALGEDSGIVRFAKRYKLVEVIEDRTNADAWRIFGKCDPTKPESLREDTRLQRLAKAHLVAGGSLDRGYGFFTI